MVKNDSRRPIQTITTGTTSTTITPNNVSDTIAVPPNSNTPAVTTGPTDAPNGGNRVEGNQPGSNVGIKIAGDNCKVSAIKIIGSGDKSFGIQIHGSGNTLENIRVEGACIGVQIKGHRNKLSKIGVENATVAIEVEGDENKLDIIQVKNATRNAVTIAGKKNELDGVSCRNTKSGIEVNGDDNKLLNTLIRDPIAGRNWKPFTGINLATGNGNIVDNLKCEGLQIGEGWGLEIGAVDTTNATVSNSTCGPVSVRGKDHKLVNVDAGPLLQIYGKDHKLDSCKAKELQNAGSNITFVGCDL